MSETAGSLLRRARTAQGLHIAALAASLKVPPRKLELLETDRYDELPDLAFVRSLAITLCRTLKIDADPVLALLPPSLSDGRLDHVAAGLNEPFRDRPGRHVPSEWSALAVPGLWGAGLLLLAAAVVYLWPELRSAGEWANRTFLVSHVSSFSQKPATSLTVDVPAPAAGPSPTAALAAATKPLAAPVPITVKPEPTAAVTQTPTAPVQATAAAPESMASVLVPAREGALHLSVASPSWIKVTDGHGRALLSRILRADEAVTLDGTPPFRLTIGNVSSTRVQFRGEAVDLAAQARNNVARIELK